MAKNATCELKDEFDKIEQRVEQLGEQVYKTGAAKIMWFCYQDFVSSLLRSGYTVSIKMDEANGYKIKYWKED